MSWPLELARTIFSYIRLTLRVCHYYTAVILAGYISCMCWTWGCCDAAKLARSLPCARHFDIANTTLWGVDIERHRRYFSFNTSSINQSHSQDVDTNYIYGSVLSGARVEMRCALEKLQNAPMQRDAKVLTRGTACTQMRFLALSACLKFAQSKPSRWRDWCSNSSCNLWNSLYIQTCNFSL